MNYQLYISELIMRFKDVEERLFMYDKEHKEVLVGYQKLIDERKAIINQLREIKTSLID